MNQNNQPNPFMPQDAATSVATPTTPTAAPMPMPGGTAAGANDTFEVDLTNVQSGNIIPDGEYTIRLLDVEQGVSKADNPQYIWTFVIVEGDHAGAEFKVFTALTPAAMWKVAEVVESLGIGQTGQAVRFRKSDVIGRQCVGVIEKQTYNNTERSQITRTLALGQTLQKKANPSTGPK